MLFGLDLNEVIRAIGVLGIAGIVFAESGLMVGFFLPGDTLLFAAGFLTQQHVLDINVNFLVLILFFAAIAGDNIGYTFGSKVGRKLFKRPDSILFHQDNLRRAEKFYERFGPVAVLLARFVPVVRTFAPIVSGVGNMRYRTFVLFDILGALLWTTSVTYLGYFGGAFLKQHGINVEELVLPVIGLAVLLSVVSPLYHILREPKGRELLLRKLRLSRKKS